MAAGAIGAGISLAWNLGADWLDDGEINRGWRSYGASAARGLVSGMMMGALSPTSTISEIMLMGFLSGGAGNAAYQLVNGGSFDYNSFLMDAAMSGTTAGILGSFNRQSEIARYAMEREIATAKLNFEIDEGIRIGQEKAAQEEALKEAERLDRLGRTHEIKIAEKARETAAREAAQKKSDQVIMDRVKREAELNVERANEFAAKTAQENARTEATAQLSSQTTTENVSKEIVNNQQATAKSNLNAGADSPSSIAQSWQGNGNYPGIDDWVDVTLLKGTKVWGGAPGQSNFYTSNAVMKSVGNDAKMLNQGLQIGKNGYSTFRPDMTMYELTSDITVGCSKALANPQYGAGGSDQYFLTILII